MNKNHDTNPLIRLVGFLPTLIAAVILFCLAAVPDLYAQTLQMHFPFNEPGTATTTTDSVAGVSLQMVAYGNIATTNLHGGINSGPKGLGNSLLLTNTQQGVNGSGALNVNSPINFGTISNFTCTFWLKPRSSFKVNFCRLFSLGVSGSNEGSATNGFQILSSGGSYSAGTAVNTYVSGHQIAAAGPWGVYNIPNDTWTFLAETFDGTNVVLYGGSETNPAAFVCTTNLDMNGKPFGPITPGANWRLALGNRFNLDRCFNGSMADVRLYLGTGDSGFIETVRSSVSYQTNISNLAVVPTCGQALLSWSAAAGASGYIVKRSATAGTETNYATAGTASYTDYGVSAGNTFYYSVIATNVQGILSTNNPEISTVIPGSFSFVSQPASQTVCAGSAAAFSVVTSGGSGLTFQWQSSTNGGINWNDAVGATSTTYAPTVSYSDNGTQYRVVVNTSDCGATPSEPAILTVNPAPAILLQPVSQTIVSNWSVSFVVRATNVTTYQWMQNGTNLVDGAGVTGSAGPVLTLANVPLSESGATFACAVGSSCITVTSSPPATLTVNSSLAQNLAFDFGFEDTGATTTDSVNGVSLNLYDLGAAPYDLHGPPGSGVVGHGKALDLSYSGYYMGQGGGMAAASGISQVALGTVGSYTMTLWFKPVTSITSTPGNQYPRLFVLGTNGTVDGIGANRMMLQSDGTQFLPVGSTTALNSFVNGVQTPTQTWGAFDIKPNQWRFAALTYDGATLKLYMGSEAGTATLVAAQTNFIVGPLNFGSSFDLMLGNRLDQARAFVGYMDDVRFYQGAASLASVETIRQASVDTSYTLVSQPASQILCEGSSAYLSVVTSGGSGLTYQWQSGTNGIDWNTIADATNSIYTTPALVAADSGTQFRVLITSAYGTTPSLVATVTVQSPAGIITAQPLNQTAVAGWTPAFAVQLANATGTSYQWRRNGTNLVDGTHVSGATNAILTLPNIALADSGATFDCVVVSPNACSPLTTSAATLTVNPSLANNLALQFQFADSGNTTTDSVAGVTLNLVDATGNPVDLHGSPGSGPGGLGTALVFNAANHGVAGPLAYTTGNSMVNLGVLNSFTITLWLNPTVSLTNSGVAFARYFILGTNGIVDGQVANSINWLNGARVYNGGSSTACDAYVNKNHVPQATWGPYPQPTNHWTFLALTYDGASLRLYGGDPTSPVVLATSTDILNSPVDLSSSPFSLFLGNRLNRDRSLAGMLGDVRLYHGAASVGSLDAIRQSAVPAVTTPVASFTALPASGTRPLLVTFTDHSTGTITNLLWTFGDGATTNTAAGSVATHIYGVAGSFNAILTASGPGGSTSVTNVISVAVPNQPHVASLTAGTVSLTMQGNNGPASAGQTYYYWLLTSTNLSLPRASWTVVATNAFNPDGSFSNTVPVVPGDANRFYLLQMP